MSDVDEILQTIPMDQLAQQLGTDPATAQQAAGKAITALLGGIHDNAQTPDGEQALAQALDAHGAANLLGNGQVDGQVNLDAVDTSDGEKILGHVFGQQNAAVVQALSSGTALDQGMVNKLLPILAPIVLAYLARHMAGGKYGNILGPILTGGAIGGGANVLGQILSHVLGGHGQTGSVASSQSADDTVSVPQATQPTQDAGFQPSSAQSGGVGPGGLTMGDDDSVASADTGNQTQAQPAQPASGRVLGQILGGLLHH